MASLELYVQPGCPYCQKVEDKLDDLGLEYERHTVSRIRFNRPEVKEISGQRGVPVLVDEDHGIEGMAESDDIVAYLDRTYGE
ncbi:MAG: glutathione S-transferase N-terminal domain-containing protein [Halanaeroarchaeum sp.]